MVEIVDITYGDKFVSDQTVRNNLRQAIESHETFVVTNENLGGDTEPGERKSCCIRWRDYSGGPLLGETVYEGDRFNFCYYIKMITYGGAVLTDKPWIYDRLHQVWKSRDTYDENRKWNPFAGYKDQDQVELGNEFFGWDPKPGVKKEIIIELAVKDVHEEDDRFRYEEGDKWPPRSIDTDQYFDSAVAPELTGQIASSMMNFRY